MSIADRWIWIEGDRIKAIGRFGEFDEAQADEVIDARGKWVIPGLMDANVHLLLDMRLENLVRFEKQYEDLITEAAQIALKNGVTTVFDTWGPRQHLVSVRGEINAGRRVGSRIFCAGNIIGLGGPLSEDFLGKSAEIASAQLALRINHIWAETVGPELTWMTPDAVAERVRSYIARGEIDFVKFASSEHRVPMGGSAFLALSPRVQTSIVDEAHAAGITAQAHVQSVEALRVSIEAGADIIQHCNITGPVPIPESTLALLAKRGTACTVFPLTRRRARWLAEHGDVLTRRLFTEPTVATNVKNLITSGATLLLATDSGVLAAESSTDAALGAVYSGEDNLFELGEGHFHWLRAMEERGLAPMEALRAATVNVAKAYQKDRDLGSLEAGKIADIVILDKNPLQDAENYRSIHKIIQAGKVIDRSSLPTERLLSVLQPSNGLKPAFLGPVSGLPPCCGLRHFDDGFFPRADQSIELPGRQSEDYSDPSLTCDYSR